MKTFIIYLGSVLLIFTCCFCSSNNKEEALTYPYYMKATVNGKPFEALAKNETENNIVRCEPYLGDFYGNSNSSAESIALLIETNSPFSSGDLAAGQTYPFSRSFVNRGGATGFVVNQAVYTAKGQENYTTLSNSVNTFGQITITKYDKPNRIIEGTFFFTASQLTNPNNKVEVKDGVFRMYAFQ